MSRLPSATLSLFLAIVAGGTTSQARITDSSDRSADNGDENGVDVNLLFSTPEGRRGLDDMELAPLVAACVAIFIGVVLCFAGARALRYAALGCAFFDGAFGTAVILEQLLAHAEWQGVVSWTFFFLGGILCCLLVVSVDRADVLCVGVTAGLLTAFTCLTTFGYLLAPDHPDLVLYGLLVVCGVGMGMLTLKTEPVSVVLVTSWIGSNVATWGIGYFFGEYPNGTTIEKFRRASDSTYALPNAWWGYLAGALCLFLLGVCVQALTFEMAPKQQRRPRPMRGTTVATVLPELDAIYDQDERGGRYVSVQTPARSSARPSSSSRGFTQIV